MTGAGRTEGGLDTELPFISIILPTYHECENLPELFERISRVRRSENLNLEVIVVDDDSGDGTHEFIENLPKSEYSWVSLILRKGRRDLSSAVVTGMQQAKGELLVVMDADLSHEPETLPRMLDLIKNSNTEFVIGSRNLPDSRVDENWGVLRRLNSYVATLLARPLIRLSDPMSGFFCIRKSRFLQAQPLNPMGYKIGLELLIKTKAEIIKEFPIQFYDRKRGKSKFSLKEIAKFLIHLQRLYFFSLTQLFLSRGHAKRRAAKPK